MNCSDRDQDILLHEHGALTGLARLGTAWHLRHCPRCQERREHMAAVSGLMAGAIREHELPQPAFPRLTFARSEAVGRMRPAPAARPAFVLTVVGMAMAVVACAMVYKATALAMPVDPDSVPPHVTYIYRSAPRSRARPAPAPSPCAPSGKSLSQPPSPAKSSVAPPPPVGTHGACRMHPGMPEVRSISVTAASASVTPPSLLAGTATTGTPSRCR